MKIKRLCFNKLHSEMREPEASILLGARQVGKSTLMRQLKDEAQRSGFKTAFYDLEQFGDLQQLSGDPQNVADQLSAQTAVVFIDEFHYLPNASKIFKAIVDSRRGVKIYASGSSSLEIHRHLKESLAGRFIKTMIYPLSLEEWQQVPGFSKDRYLQWGGMPGLIHRSTDVQKADLLDNVVNTYITKDIKGLIREENVRAFNLLLYVLAQSQGGLGVAANLAMETGLSEVTVARHLEIMAQTYVLYGIPSFSTNMANELKKSKKYFLFDVGIRNALLKDFSRASVRDDKGCLYETSVLLHLIMQLKPNMEIRFWRTKKGDEVDFVVLKNRIPVPVEVKSKLVHTDGVPEGMVRFLKAYPKAPMGFVYNEEKEAEVLVEGRPVYFRRWEGCGRMEYMQSLF